MVMALLKFLFQSSLTVFYLVQIKVYNWKWKMGQRARTGCGENIHSTGLLSSVENVPFGDRGQKFLFPK